MKERVLKAKVDAAQARSFLAELASCYSYYLSCRRSRFDVSYPAIRQLPRPIELLLEERHRSGAALETALSLPISPRSHLLAWHGRNMRLSVCKRRAVSTFGFEFDRLELDQQQGETPVRVELVNWAPICRPSALRALVVFSVPNPAEVALAPVDDPDA